MSPTLDMLCGLGFNGGMATKAQNAETIAREAIVFVRNARRDGCANTVTRDLIYDMAEMRGIGGEDYSIRTVKTILRRNAAAMGETHLLEI